LLVVINGAAAAAASVKQKENFMWLMSMVMILHSEKPAYLPLSNRHQLAAMACCQTPTPNHDYMQLYM
jgi:hypothetical protein